MTPISIALNRFGLGYRREDALPNDAKIWLKQQIAAYEPAPSALGGRSFGGADARSAVAETFAFRGRRDEAGTDRRAEIQQARLKNLRNSYIGEVALRARLALESDTPFMERLVHFWSNHFAVSVDKSQVPTLIGAYEFGAIRPHVAGHFRDLLKAASLHPAMLAYLDQFQSQGPDSPAAKARQQRGRPMRGLNENLGREILELHTLGVGGGYTQEDVKELARALTGWTMQGIPYADKARPQANGAAFFDWIHQPGTRRIMGRSYADEGERQALAILDDLAVHPSTARFIATKLARHFAGDTPPQPLVDRLADTFRETEGHLPSLYTVLVDAPECWVSQPVKFRQPWEWAIGMIRASGQAGQADRQFAIMMRALGQEVWQPGSPAGWDDREASWAAPNAILRRVEAAERFAEQTRLEDTRALAEAMFPGSLSESTMQTIRWAESNEMGFALLLVSPEMMRR
ncbi:DUF1800 family protein [Erythrobacter sp. SD-21]|uniref:DUF1800 domain-containing protein n=1 Tax=Erythrobacter sp. SD-21 TaxID=161528 RepID=UPI0005501302|nr:DUF1800 domain-containing protein [Erythrobacter sp. SD-21]